MTVLVFPVVAPETSVSVGGVVDIAIEGAITVTGIVAVFVREPLVPVTTTLNLPALPGTVLIVTMLLPAPLDVKVTGVGVTEQVAPVVV